MDKLYSRTCPRVHPAILQGIRIRRKLFKRITPIERKNYDRLSTYNKAVEKQNLFLTRLAVVLICILEQRDIAIENARKLREAGILKGSQEFYHVISLMKLYCIMSGGMKIVRTQKGFPHVPLKSTHNGEVKLLLEIFFERRLRGNQTSGSSKWVVKEIPKFGHHIMSILNKIRQTNKDLFEQIGSYLISKDTDTISLNFCPIHTVDPKDLNELLDHFRSSSVFNKKHDDFR